MNGISSKSDTLVLCLRLWAIACLLAANDVTLTALALSPPCPKPVLSIRKLANNEVELSWPSCSLVWIEMRHPLKSDRADRPGLTAVHG